jgi:radical SAM protein with 4Fe4S-binding SPASM domain
MARAGHLDLQIETTSTCQAACFFCPYPKMERWGGNMNMPLFRKIVDDAVTIPQIQGVVLHGLGEPALDRHLVERVKYVAATSIRSIGIFTNGINMTPQRIDALVDAGLTHMVFSVNAVRPDQHEAIMGVKGKLLTVIDNAQYAIRTYAVHHRLYVECHAVVSEKFDMSDFRYFVNFWGPYANVIRKNNWSGDVESPNKSPFGDHVPCGRAISQIYVMHDGRVTMCCLDPSGKTVFGDLKSQSLRDVYNSPEYTAFREAHANGRAADYTACNGCSRT